MEIELIRTILSDDFTEGELRINGHFFCHTLEDRVRRLPADKKIPGLTAIPAGTYRVTVSVSPKFGRYLPLVENVPYFSGIRIHRGNTAGDTSGCILVGESAGRGLLKNSTEKERTLTSLLLKTQEKGETITIRIS